MDCGSRFADFLQQVSRSERKAKGLDHFKPSGKRPKLRRSYHKSAEEFSPSWLFVLPGAKQADVFVMVTCMYVQFVSLD